MPGRTASPRIFYALNELNRTLLILGAPGCGKTTMLLDLARQAIEQAQEDPAQPIPAVFNLSSWSVKQQPIADWLVDELNDKYIVPRKVGKPWVEQDQLLLLLDGLDEVETEYQEACVRALNQFNQESRMPIVICCRDNEYEVLPLRLRFQAAVFLKPLTPEQIAAYVSEDTAELAALAEALRADPQLCQLAQTPLILNTMMRAYEGMSPQTLESLDAATARRYLFDAYVQRMFQRGSLPHHFSQEQTIRWLSWLARKMDEHSQAIFLIERMQPDWLSTPGQRRLHVLLSRLAISLPSGLVGGLILGLGFAIFFGPPREGLVRGLGEGLLSCLIGGLAVVLIDVFRLEWGDRVRAAWQMPRRAQLALNILIVTLVVGASVWLSIGSILGGINWLGYSAAGWWLEGGLVGLLVGLSFGFIFGFGTRGDRQLLTEDVQTVEYLSWSPATAVVGAVYGLVAGVVSGLILWLGGLNVAAVSEIFAEGRILWVAIPVLTFAGAIFGGLRGSIVQSPTKANQGIRLSLVNAAVMGSAAGLTFAAIGAILGGLSMGSTAAFTLAAYGLFFGLLAAIWYGGFDVIKHASLRFILYRRGAIPLRYAHFLDYAAERIFLRKVGGGYIFIHRLLADHFASDEK
ncbi:MAG TPA: NACHT domain-containing protein [Anaerolineae bacterium]